jgi:hypothetical protein
VASRIAFEVRSTSLRYVVQECLNRGMLEFVRLEFAKDVMDSSWCRVAAFSLIDRHLDLEGSMKPFFTHFARGSLEHTYRGTIAGLLRDWSQRLGETTG